MNEIDKKVMDYIERAKRIENESLHGFDAWKSRVVEVAKMIQLEELKKKGEEF